MIRLNPTLVVLVVMASVLASLAGCAALLLALRELAGSHESMAMTLCTMATASFTASATLGARWRPLRAENLPDSF